MMLIRNKNYNMFKTILINGFLICLVFTQVFANSKTVKLSSGYDMPLVGLGTWNMKPDEVDDAVTNALNNGYQHIDTAFVYSNEEAIGNTLKKWFDNGGKREDLFITTKLPPFGNRASDVEKAFNISMEKLGLDYVDMYLNHGPFAIKSLPNIQPIVHQNGTFEFDKNNDIVAVWKEMEKLVKSGRARSIGLSNFNISQISRILDAAEIKPSNLQVELQIYNQQKGLREFCKKHDIAVTGYSTLGSAGAPNFAKSPNLKNLPRQLENPVVKKIAEKHNKTPAQILLKHAVQNKVIVIPKSTHLNRIKENIDLFDFELTEDDLKEIDNLDLGEKGRMFDFLFFKGIEKHPEFPFADQLHKS